MTSIMILLAMSAPVPIPKMAPPRPAITGQVWELEWHGAKGHCEFRSGGSWWAWWGGREWAGTWSQDGDTIRVHEWVPSQHEWEATRLGIKWDAKLVPGRLEGRTGGGGSFALRKPE